jgi:hypothetical protein
MDLFVRVYKIIPPIGKIYKWGAKVVSASQNLGGYSGPEYYGGTEEEARLKAEGELRKLEDNNRT